MKKFTEENLIGWLQSVYGSLEPDPAKGATHDIDLNFTNVETFLFDLFAEIHMLYPQLIGQLGILEPSDIESRDVLSDSLVIVYKPSLKQKGTHVVTTSSGKIERVPMYAYPVKDSLMLNLYPSMFQDNPSPFLMISTFLNGVRVKDVAIPVHIPFSAWNMSLRGYISLLLNTPLTRLIFGVNIEPALNQTLGFGRDRALTKLLKDAIDEPIYDSTLSFFDNMNDLIRIEQRRAISRQTADSREKQRKRKALLDQEMHEDMQRFGFTDPDQLFAFEEELESLNSVERNLRVRAQIQIASEAQNRQRVATKAAQLIQRFNLPSLLARPFDDPKDLLVELSNAQVKRAKDLDPNVTLTHLGVLNRVELYLEDYRDRNQSRKNPRRSTKNVAALLAIAGTGYWFANRNK